MQRDTNSTDPQQLLQPEVIALGRALRPTLAKMLATLRSSPPTGEEVATIELVEHYLSSLENACDDMVAKVQELGQALAAGSDETAIHRAVGAFEAHLQVMQDGYVEVLAWEGTRSERQGRDLLAEVYRDALTQIKDWIEEIVETVEKPLAAVKRRGLQDQKEVTLAINLTLRSPPDLEHLMDWAEQNAVPNRGGTGFWRIVAGTVLGIGIADFLFLEDE